MTHIRTTTELPAPDLARHLPLGDLLALGAQLRADLSPAMLLQDVADAIVRVLGLSRVYIRLRNPDTDVLEACAFAGIPDATIARLVAGPVAPARYQALLQPEARLSESYLVDEDPDHAFPHDDGMPQTLLVPLRGSGERLTGVIYVDVAAHATSLDVASVQILEAIARQAALALENARHATSMQRLLAKEQLLTALGRRVSATLDLQAIAQLTVERLQHAFPNATLLLGDSSATLQIAASSGTSSVVTPEQHCAAGAWAWLQGLPFLSNNLASDPRLRSDAGLPAGQAPQGSLIAVPLRSGGRSIGALSASSSNPDSFTYEDVDLLEAVAAQIGGPISGAQLYQQTQRLAEQIRRRNEHLLVINTLASMAVSTHDLERVLQAVTGQIHQGFGYGHVELYEVDEDTHEAVLVATASEFEQGTLGYRQQLSQGVIGRSYASMQTVLVDRVARDPDYVGNRAFDSRSELCVPIVANGRVLALLNVESDRDAAFSNDDIAALETTADVLASAIENARLSRRAQEAAVLEERSRLARDLHDSVSQQLFSMTLTSQAARAQLEKNPQRAATQLERLQETAQAALAEMRALIFQLRPPGLSEMGLVAALQQYVASVNKREDIHVCLNISGEERNGRGAEQAIYRIVQEALNNVVKHAGNCEVEIDLSLAAEQLQLVVRDNGRGFDPYTDSIGGRHLGLVSMRERAAELGGALELVTAPGQGTTITVVVPRSHNLGQ
jgi:signal transduction histidine kinase